MKILKKLILFGLVLLVVSCRSDKPEEVEPTTSIDINKSKGVFILNEGNFMWNNASVDYYKTEDQKLFSDLFSGVNNKTLGDVLQSMTVYNGKAYLVVNNSGKIEIVDPTTFQSIGVISGMKSPRYFLGVSSFKAYVSDYKSNSISVVDLNSQSKVKDIKCAGWTEEMLLFENKVFVANVQREYVYVIDVTSDKVTDSIKVGYGPGFIVLDKNSKVWVLSNGDLKGKKAALTRINPVDNSIEQAFIFSSTNDSPLKLRLNANKDVLYFINKGIYKMDITAAQLPTTAFIPDKGTLFYGLGINPANGDIYVADAIDFVQKGKVFRYNSNAELIAEFDGGFNPSDFYFY